MPLRSLANLHESKVHVLVSLFDRSSLSKQKCQRCIPETIDLRQDQKDVNSCQKATCKKLSGSGCHSSPAFGTMGGFGAEVSTKGTCNWHTQVSVTLHSFSD